MKFTWEVVEDPEPDPHTEAWLDYLSALGKVADTYYFYIGPARSEERPRSGDVD